MLTVEPGMAARSLAGHDKGQWYLILRVEGREVYLIETEEKECQTYPTGEDRSRCGDDG